LARGEIIGLVGESGSGKTTTALAFFGYCQHGAKFASGTVTVPDRPPVDLVSAASVRELRGRYFSYVPQNPGMALNPVMRIGQLLDEVSNRRRAVDAVFAANVARVTDEVLGIVDLPTSQEFRQRYPHQLSGGQQQRVCIAMALLSGSKAIVLDEPTTGLDVVTQAAIIEELRRLRDEHGVSMVYISHDLAVVAELADQVAVMYSGQIVEVGDTAGVLHRPRHEYTRKLLAARPDINRSGVFRRSTDDALSAATPSGSQNTAVLDVRNLCISHRVRGEVTASVKNIEFSLERG
jgi:peptide/nickel transport system ATP-binding protein